MSIYKIDRRVFSDRDLEQLDEAIQLNRIAGEKDRANDEAFRAYYLDGDRTRSRRSLAASARNRERAFQRAAGDADRAWLGLPRHLLTERIEELQGSFDLSFDDRVAAMEQLRDELRGATNLTDVLA